METGKEWRNRNQSRRDYLETDVPDQAAVEAFHRPAYLIQKTDVAEYLAEKYQIKKIR